MKNKAIIIDLDGVVVDSPKQKLPSKKLVQLVVCLQDDYYLCAATGRVWTFAKPILEALGLTDPCIISAGTQICNPATGKVLWQKFLSKKALVKAIKFLSKYPEYKLLFNDINENDYFYGGINPKDFPFNQPVYVLNQVFVPNKIAEKIYRELNKIEGVDCVMATAQKPGCKDLHIVNREATKEQAVAKLLGIIGVEPENTIGIGDGLNDIHLFNAVNYKVAMGNAVKDLKDVADEVIGSVKDDGLVDFLAKLVL